MQGGKSQQRTLAHLVSTALKTSTSCVIFQECPMDLCLLAPFGKDQKDAQQPLHLGKPGKAAPAQNPPCAGLCGGQACGLVREKPSGAKHRLFLTEKRRVSPPVRACGRRFHPRWGKQPVPVRSGAIWAPQGPVWQKEKKPPTTPVGGEFGGVKKKQVKGPGSLEASRAGSLRPAEPVVEGFFPGVNFPFFRGRFWGLGVTDGVRKAKFPGGKPFSRVSPPGSTKG